MSGMTVGSYWPLALLALLPVVWLLAWHNRVGAGRLRMIGATVLRSLALVAVVVALMRPTLQIKSADLSVAYVVDISASVSSHFLDQALNWIGQVNTKHKPAQSRLVVFADRAKLLDSVEEARSLTVATGDGPRSRQDLIHQSATNLETGLLATLPGFEPGSIKRIVLLSDGNETEGDVWRALPRLRAEGVRVFTIPAETTAENDAWVEAIVVPDGVHERTAVDVEARLFSQQRAPAQVDLLIGERMAASRVVKLAPGDNRVAFNVHFPRAGLQRVTARVRAKGDQFPGNDALTDEVLVQPRLRVLYVEGGKSGASYLADALTEQGMRVSSASPQNLSNDARLLADKDVIILSDVRADGLSRDATQRLQAFVRDQGGGLIFVAGENTYGQEGFASSEVEKLLPVKFEAKRKRQDLDLVLLLDRSSSMRRGKIEAAKSAALATVDLLDPEQGLAVVAFDSQPQSVVPLAPVGDKRKAQELISRMTSSGQTNIYTALLEAQRLLMQSKAEVKHIILLSDGYTARAPDNPGVSGAGSRGRTRFVNGSDPWPKDDEPLALGFRSIVAELAAANITLSTVVLGEGYDLEFMSTIAKWGHGKCYLAKTDEDTPGLFVGEIRRLRGDSIIEEPFRPHVKAWSPTIAGVDFATAPALKGYVESKPKRFSDVLLEAKKDLPLLAETHYGLGKTVLFASDAKDRWATDWLRWPGYSTLWAQVVRDSARRDAGDGLSWRVVRDGSNALIQLTALGPGGSFRHDLWPQARVTAPSGISSVVALRQVAPGRYAAQVPLTASATAPWRFELLPSRGMGAAEVARAGARSLFYAYSDEFRLLPANLPLLRTLSEQTGGVFTPAAEQIFKPLGDGGVTSAPLWRYFVAAALLLFLIDILVRRAPWLWHRTR